MQLSASQQEFVTSQGDAIEQVVATHIGRHPEVLLRHQRSDLMQQATLGFCRAMLSYHDGIQQTLAVYSICAARKSLRQYVSTGYLEVVSDADVPEPVQYDDTEPSLIGCVLQRLKPGHQQVLTICYGLNGTAPMSDRQAAKFLGRNYKSVQRMKKRAKEALARYAPELNASQQPES